MAGNTRKTRKAVEQQGRVRSDFYLTSSAEGGSASGGEGTENTEYRRGRTGVLRRVAAYLLGVVVKQPNRKSAIKNRPKPRASRHLNVECCVLPAEGGSAFGGNVER